MACLASIARKWLICVVAICMSRLCDGEKIIVSKFIEMLHKQNMYVRLVIGFSTGHVGTTFFSNASAYSSIGLKGEIIDFVFEKAAVSKKDYARNYTIQNEIKHFENVYGPYLLEHAKATKEKLVKLANTTQESNENAFSSINNYTIADLSHASLYFYRGLIHVVERNRDRLSIHFVRIRRDRVETVISMTADNQYFRNDWYRYHPQENVQNVVMATSDLIWSSFSKYEMACWIIDETEARWNKFLNNHQQLSYSEVLWGSRWDDSAIDALEDIADTLGTSRNYAVIPAKNEHARKRRKEDNSLQLEISRLDREYQKTMMFEYIPL